MQDHRVQEREDALCKNTRRQRETRGCKHDGLLHLHGFQLCWGGEAALKGCAGEEGKEGGLCVPPPRQRFGRCCGRSWGCPAAPLCPPCLSSPSVPEHNAPFTPRQTGGLDALPAFCCQGHRLGSVPSSFSLRRSGIAPRAERCAPPEGVTPLPKHTPNYSGSSQKEMCFLKGSRDHPHSSSCRHRCSADTS